MQKRKPMIKTHTEINFDETEIKGIMAICPVCGQKIGEIRYLKGIVMLRVKCRRCKHYIDINATGNGE